jgi:transposase-like protein
MSISLIVIAQLSILLVAAVAVLILQWKSRRREITDLLEQNKTLMLLVEDQQSHNELHSNQEQSLVRQLTEAEQDLNQQIVAQENPAAKELEHLQEHFQTEKERLVAYLKEGELDRTQLQQMVESLTRKLERAGEIITQHQLTQRQQKELSKTLKNKLSSLSADLIKLKSLGVTRDRLERDKTRLKERLEQLDKKYQEERLLTQNLQQELKTSFRASEVAAMRDELKNTEELLQRTLAEKEFIERHFLEIAEEGPEHLQQELEMDRE